eukprot:scaffold407_cov251-Pinguiococcus_pyrenoidosus.AAC.39
MSQHARKTSLAPVGVQLAAHLEEVAVVAGADVHVVLPRSEHVIVVQLSLDHEAMLSRQCSRVRLHLAVLLLQGNGVLPDHQVVLHIQTIPTACESLLKVGPGPLRRPARDDLHAHSEVVLRANALRAQIHHAAQEIVDVRHARGAMDHAPAQSALVI